jgi:sterol desaturase/sphingolipid hydroxylase (fatty acid hydroxylase superfamily)
MNSIERRCWSFIAFAAALILIRAIWVAGAQHAGLWQSHAVASYVRSAWSGFRATVFDPFYWIAIGALSVAQLLWPAERDKRRPSHSVAEDAAWFVFSTVLIVTVLGASIAPLNLAYEHLAGGKAFNLTPTLGVWGVALLAFVIADLLAWCAHWLHHHVATLWYFHAIHHSQANLNVLSDNRQHFVETIINAAIAYLPARALGLNSPDALKLASLTIYWSALIHTNIRTNLGPLRYVLVSPQAHRVHHSVSPEYFNTNYGTFLVCWDIIFRTVYPDYDIYPATGIDDMELPELARRPSGRVTPVGVATLWIRQTIHPFRLALQKTSGYAGNAATARTSVQADRIDELVSRR